MNSSNIQELSSFFTQGSKNEICHIFWEDYPYPIYLRRACSDWFNFLQIFVDQEYDFPLKPDIKMIVDLGSYIGLSAVFLANKYPLAQIICLEPSIENYELLKLNTRPYSQIICKHAAIWNQATKVKFHQQINSDWSNQFFPDPKGDIPALGIKDLVEEYTIEQIDFLKVDIEGGERALFSKNYENWLPRVKAISCELHDRFVPGCSDAYFKLFRNPFYQELHSGEFICFIKK